MTEGGQGIKFYCHTEQTKEKIRKKLKGKPKSLESRENYRLANLGENNPMYGKISHWRGTHLSDKNKENLRKLYKNKTYEEIHGKEKAKDIKNQLSISLKGKNIGKIVTDETKNKLRQSSIEQFASEEGKIKHKNATKLAMQSPEIRKRFLEGIQKREEKRKLKKYYGKPGNP
jgi:ribosomal protein S18